MTAETETQTTAYRCHRVLEPLHSMIYFAPEAEEHFTAAGLESGRMQYFAGRSAPMGAVAPEVVPATVYNFSPRLVAKNIPAAWGLASPERIVEARWDVARAALRRLLGAELADSPAVAEAAELARTASAGCTPEGRPLYAGHAGLDWPDEPILVLWHAITLLREHRGDGHIAALVGNGLNGIDALRSHTATGKGFVARAAQKLRGWTDEEWAASGERLGERGLLDADGGLTEAGTRQREAIEEQTNASAVAPYLTLGEDKSGRLHEVGRELSRAVVAGGAFPAGVFAAPK